MSLALLVPMRQQPIRRELFRYTLERTAGPTAIQLIVRVDDDDPETADWCRASLPCHLVVGPRYDGYRSLPRFYNEMVAHLRPETTAIMCGNDDMRFETVNWAGILCQRAKRYRGGLFNLGVMTFPAGAFPFSCVSPRLVETLGFLNDERLIYSDIFLRDVHMRLNGCEIVPSVTILHIGEASREAVGVKETADVAYWQLHAECVRQAVERLKPVVTRKVWGWREAWGVA